MWPVVLTGHCTSLSFLSTHRLLFFLKQMYWDPLCLHTVVSIDELNIYWIGPPHYTRGSGQALKPQRQLCSLRMFSILSDPLWPLLIIKNHLSQELSLHFKEYVWAFCECAIACVWVLLCGWSVGRVPGFDSSSRSFWATLWCWPYPAPAFQDT